MVALRTPAGGRRGHQETNRQAPMNAMTRRNWSHLATVLRAGELTGAGFGGWTTTGERPSGPPGTPTAGAEGGAGGPATCHTIV